MSMKNLLAIATAAALLAGCDTEAAKLDAKVVRFGDGRVVLLHKSQCTIPVLVAANPGKQMLHALQIDLQGNRLYECYYIEPATDSAVVIDDVGRVYAVPLELADSSN